LPRTTHSLGGSMDAAFSARGDLPLKGKSGVAETAPVGPVAPLRG
jgi:hypothetical protein